MAETRSFLFCRVSLTRIATAFVLAMAVASLLPCPASAEPKRIYLANDDHTDYFWTADDVQYRTAFISMLDFYMAQAEATASNPSDSRGRFNCDGSIWAWEYERNKPAADFQRLVGHMRAGNITLPLNNAVLCFGAMPAEAVLRSMYYAGRLERRENLRFPLALAMENQTLPGGLASLWAGSGAKYSWRGVCGCATRTPYGNRPRDIYHYTGPDGQSVCMKWNTKPSGVTMVVGSYDEVRKPTATVKFLDSDPGFTSRWPWPVSAAFGYGGDDLESKTDSLIRVSENLSNPNRRVIVSNEIDFFEDFLAHHGSEIPNFSGSFGNEWDLYSASMGALTARFKAQIERLRTAEALASVAALLDPGFLAGREAARDRAFMAAGLYYEHDWTGDGPIPRERRAQFQRDMLRDLENYVGALHADALGVLASRVARPAAAERHVVFNPLSWIRADFADLEVATPAPLHVIDVASGAEVPSQILPGGAPTKVRILARDLPSVGYRVYEVRSGAGASFPPSATVQSPTIDNGIYAVRLGARGNITSLIDHRNGDRQLVESGGSLHDLGSGNGSVTVESSGPVSTTLRVVAGGTPAHETRVTLYAGVDRVDVQGLVTQNFSSNVSYASRFALPGAVMRHEEVGMIAKVARAAQGGDYADENTRTDYLTFNHFVDLSLPDRGVTVSNWDSPFFRAGASTTTFLDGATPAIEAVVGMQVDGYSYGIMNQGGDTQFLNRFALSSHGAFDQAAAMRFALEHQNPLVAARVTGDGAAPLPATTWSLLSLPSPDLLLWSLKPAEEGIGQGLVARVWNLAEAPRTASLTLPRLGIAEARRATHIETDLAPVALAAGALPLDLRRQQMATFRIFPERRPGDHVTILSPADRSFFATGDVIPLRLTSDGTPPAAGDVRWEVDLWNHDQLLANRVVIPGLTGQFVAESVGDGTRLRYDVRLIVTSPDRGPDTSRVSLFPEIDLEPSALATRPDTLDDVAPGHYEFTLTNHGRMPSPAFRWQLVADGTSLATGETAVPALGAVLVPLDLPARLPGGTWTLRAVADTLGTVLETNESNNATTRSLVVRDGLPPSFASGPSVAAGSDTAAVQWDTNERATGVVAYGTTPALGGSAVTTASSTRQSVRLGGLSPGTRYHYRVTVTDAAGNATVSAPDSFTTVMNLPPVARAAATPASGLAPLTVALSSAGSHDPEGGALSFRWNFGNGQTSTAANPSHVYPAGRYDVVLTVTDALGASASATVTVVSTGTPVFPATPVLDNFNRPDAAIGSSWIDTPAGMSIRTNQLAQTTSNVWSIPVWGVASYGPDQEAYVTLVAITSNSPEHDVLLKVQGNSHLNGHIEVKYDAVAKMVFVSTYSPSGGWTTHGSISVTLAAGDRLGARALANGTVDVYRNTAKLMTASVAAWPYAAQGGRIGLTVAKATSSRLDDFGGGNVGADLTPPVFVSAPTVTPGRDSAVVRWTAGEAARGVVRYGRTAALGDSIVVAPATAPVVVLAGLARGTAYSYQVAIFDDSGNSTIAPLATFSTLPNRVPVAAAAGSPLSGPAPLTVTFSSAGSSDPDGDALTRRWTFGDGSAATGSAPSHLFARPGTYSVMLTVDDGRGGTASAPLSVTATDGPPVAILSTPAPGSFFAIGDTIALAGSGTDPQDAPTALTYRWEVDLHDDAGVLRNAHTLSGASAWFVAASRGDGASLWYDARFIVTDTGGLADSAAVTVHAEVDLVPARLVPTPASPRAGQPVDCAITLRNTGRMPASLVRWRFTVDGATRAEGDVAIPAGDSVIVTHALPSGLAAGDHTLAAAVDPLGQVVETHEQNNTIAVVTRVLPAPDVTPPAFASGPSVTPDRNSAVLRWTTSEPASGVVRYGAGGGTTDSVTTPRGLTHVASIAGLARGTGYDYTVAIVDTAGNAASTTGAFTTLPNRSPVANASATPASGSTPLSVTLSSAGSSDPDGDALTFRWTFGDGQSATGAGASHTYSAGSYVAILEAVDAFGGSDTASVPITVISGPPSFPSSRVLDGFDRANATLGLPWTDGASGFRVNTNRLTATTTSRRSTVWNGGSFGADQEAYVTLSSFTTSADNLCLMMKVQGTTYGSPHIQVRYDASTRKIRVTTYAPGQGWVLQGTSTSVTFVPGEVLGARALANGDLELYRNGTKIRTLSIAPWPFATSGGRIGLTLAGSSASNVDDFGGGNVGSGIAAAAHVAEIETGGTSLESAPRALQLSAAIPNPSRGSVSFELELPDGRAVELGIHDLQGRTVWSERREYGAGRWTVSWSGVQRNGTRAPRGVYLMRLSAGGERFTRRFVLVE